MKKNNSKKIIKDKNLEIFTEQLRKQFTDHLKKIILFGSRARGDNDRDSDYDFLLILDKVTPEIENKILDLEGEIGCEYGVVFSTFPFTEEDLHRRRYSPFIINARKEGTIL